MATNGNPRFEPRRAAKERNGGSGGTEEIGEKSGVGRGKRYNLAERGYRP